MFLNKKYIVPDNIEIIFDDNMYKIITTKDLLPKLIITSDFELKNIHINTIKFGLNNILIKFIKKRY